MSTQTHTKHPIEQISLEPWQLFREKAVYELQDGLASFLKDASVAELYLLTWVFQERASLVELNNSPAEGTLSDAIAAAVGLVPRAGCRLTFDTVPQDQEVR